MVDEVLDIERFRVSEEQANELARLKREYLAGQEQGQAPKEDPLSKLWLPDIPLSLWCRVANLGSPASKAYLLLCLYGKIPHKTEYPKPPRGVITACGFSRWTYRNALIQLEEAGYIALQQSSGQRTKVFIKDQETRKYLGLGRCTSLPNG